MGLKNKQLSKNDRKQDWPVFCHLWKNERVMLILAFCYFLTCFYGIDRGMSLIGFLRFMGTLFFIGYLRLLESDKRKKLCQMIPLLGCIMTVTGILGHFIPALYSFFYVADRLGGFFQYPNVFALFCLVGILLQLEERKESEKKCLIQVVLLLTGVFLSGIRTVFF